MPDSKKDQEHIFHQHSSSNAPALSGRKKQKAAEREARIDTWLRDDSLARIAYISDGNVKDGEPKKGSSA
ncbi:uncharacterized protein PpBr36_06443 [Pyricularia pennisetigena]|uniref:uncharacterized protein n=1 Tax=Pyricularia pennisetigena TaxID=1578925 RepID=UPI00114E73C3|nr:uncharacterized protein PpBr36_06443 [Pyricularia pennisetigena]TLS23592.1 hypothetical protein PpBr36_06443 [Pyricularia pennisetigena]